MSKLLQMRQGRDFTFNTWRIATQAGVILLDRLLL
jgi:hypothetical protein